MTEPWRARAACRTAFKAPGHWEAFPEDSAAAGSTGYWDRVRLFRTEFCSLCPVRRECFAAGRTEAYGIWGGLAPEERRKVISDYCACGTALDPLLFAGGHRTHHCPQCRPYTDAA